MANDGDDLFGDSSSDADTDDLIAAAKSQPIARKKGGASTTKKKGKKDTPDADDDSDFEDGKKEAAGLFDSSSEDESGPKKKKLGKKRKTTAKKPAAAKKPKKDTRSMKERMEDLAKKRAGGGGGEKGDDEPRKKRPKGDKDGKGKDDSGYKSGDSYDSVNIERTREDDDFIDADDEDPDALKELYAEQHFEDERPDEYDSEEEKKMKRKGLGGKKSGGGVDKISLTDDEGDEKTSASSALQAACRRMQKKKKEKKNLPQLEEEGMAFLKQMEAAADVDATSIANKRPAVKRLGMLPQVMEMLAKKDMVRVLLDLELLTVCKRWVQPLPNGTLGNITLRRRIFEAISSMTGENGINAGDLKHSGFGKVVMTLYMHKSETPEMKKMLKSTIEQWSRPIFQKSGNMKDLERAQSARGMHETGTLGGIARAQQFDAKQEERRKSGGAAGVARGRTKDDLAHILQKGAKTESEAANNRVRIPYSKGFQYSIRPANRTGDCSDKRNLVSAKAAAGAGRGFQDSEKRDALSKRMIDKNRKTNKQGQRSANISIEGRAVK